MDSEVLKIIADFGPMGVLALFIITGGFSLKLLVNFVSDKVMPIIQNHLVHIEESFTQLAVSFEQQTKELEIHNESTQLLVEQMRLQNTLLTNAAPIRKRKPRAKTLVSK